MIHTNIIARVERYENGIADLEPLFLGDDGQPYGKIVNARVLSQRFLLPKRFILQSGTVNHSSIPHLGTTHDIESGDVTISYDVNEVEEVELYPVYKKGDIVLVAIIERDFSDAIKGRKGNGGNNAKHELTSAVVVGKVI